MTRPCVLVDLRGRATISWAWACCLIPLLLPRGARVFVGGIGYLAGGGWDPDSRQVDTPVIPAMPTETWLARNQKRELYRRYVERCPRWQEGWALPSVTEYSSWNMAKHALQGAGR